MKTAISFVAGMIVCGLMVLGLTTVLPIQAETSLEGESENVTTGLLDLIPDIEKIYRESLTMPFAKAESKIYDPDIAEFYGELLDATGLRSQPEEPPAP